MERGQIASVRDQGCVPRVGVSKTMVMAPTSMLAVLCVLYSGRRMTVSLGPPHPQRVTEETNEKSTFLGDSIHDFASYTEGGRVIQQYTTMCHDFSPVNAILPSPHLCWSFQGGAGQIGIYLERKVYISHINIEYEHTVTNEVPSSALR